VALSLVMVLAYCSIDAELESCIRSPSARLSIDGSDPDLHRSMLLLSR